MSNQKMYEAVKVSMYFDRQTLVELSMTAKYLTKKTGFHVGRSELIRTIIKNYLHT